MTQIIVKHPRLDLHVNQINHLESLPENEQASMSLLFSYGNAAAHFYLQSKDLLPPSYQDWEEWISGLEEPIGSFMTKQGFEQGKMTLSFQRYLLEKTI